MIDESEQVKAERIVKFALEIFAENNYVLNECDRQLIETLGDDEQQVRDRYERIKRECDLDDRNRRSRSSRLFEKLITYLGYDPKELRQRYGNITLPKVKTTIRDHINVDILIKYLGYEPKVIGYRTRYKIQKIIVEHIIRVVNNPVSQDTLPPNPIPEPKEIFESPNGEALSTDSWFYIKRGKEEQIARDEIDKSRSLLKIESRGAKKTGKTSLLMRLLKDAESSCKTVYVNFHLLDRTILRDEQSLGQLLKWLLAKISKQLELEENIDKNWSTTYGEKASCTYYLEEEILEKIDEPIVLALDRLDYVFDNIELALDFFGMLRAWHDESARNQTWRKLKLILVYRENKLPKDAPQSPFNIGTTIVLQDFNLDQIKELARRYLCNWNENELKNLVKKVVETVGKHPYLIHGFIVNFAKQQDSLEKQESLEKFLSSYIPPEIY